MLNKILLFFVFCTKVIFRLKEYKIMLRKNHVTAACGIEMCTLVWPDEGLDVIAETCSYSDKRNLFTNKF